MTFLFQAAVLALGATTIHAEIKFEREFDNFPGFRFTPWISLSTQMQDWAVEAGYDAPTWDMMSGGGDLEDYNWNDLGDARQALRKMGFQQETWDCYVNHYTGYSWTQLVQEDLADAARILGYTPQLWESGGIVDTDNLSWEDLSDAQQWAGSYFCYFSDSWNGVDIPDMTNIPKLYPYFRYVPWEDVPTTQQSLAVQAGWEQDSWDYPDRAAVEFEDFSVLDDGKRHALLQMGFYEAQYDCYVNHYYDYSWQDLVDWELSVHFEAFGWNEVNFDSDNEDDYPAAWNGSWADLTDEQKEAAEHLCFFEEIWEETAIAEWTNELQFPETRFTPWLDLSDRQQTHAAALGYTRATWDVPGSADVEKKAFDELTAELQDSFRALGFYSSDQYDCYVNHYNGYDWDELSTYGVLEPYQVLGWTQEAWELDADPPASEAKNWEELSDQEKQAAQSLCYFAEVWDKSSLTVWKGVAWPRNRYWEWNELTADDRSLLQKAGWNEDTWNTPGTAFLEFMSWNSLDSPTRNALEDYGFYHDQWNCYMSHYNDYDWFELVLHNVAEHFMTFGWDEDAWRDGEEPSAWTSQWDELSETQQAAAWEICYVRETWDDLPISQWSLDMRTGGPDHSPATTATSSPSKDESGGRPGLWVFFILLLVGGGGGYYYYKKIRNGVDPYDPTAPIKEAPEISHSATDFSTDSYKDNAYSTGTYGNNTYNTDSYNRSVEEEFEQEDDDDMPVEII